MKSRQTGFTLLELLVVIAIIGVLSTIVIASLSKARMRARDAQRMSDIKQINNAIQLYILANGLAPRYDKCPNPSDQCAGGDWEPLDWDNDLGVKLRPYISKLPKDPCGSSCDDPANNHFFHYSYGSPGTSRSIPESYNIFAFNLEATLQPFGVSTSLNGGFNSQ
jgi:general secretion pathway protein G